MFDQRPITTRTHRTAAVLAAAAATALLPFTAPALADQSADALPAGVVKLSDGETCPTATLCLYRDYGRSGPAYGIGAGYTVDLSELPMGVRTAADNISSWVNQTQHTAVLVDRDNSRTRPLASSQSMEEPMGSNDSVDEISWQLS
ncbi:peptidase inhibitor family I36 protein [Planomonospora sp. ID91781]|nr:MULTISPECIES: peptidase inhibitor family I36 protein [Planomonospora]MBG0822921.1 peptidase inhibitor family I36 protein [Planomonospora sp. ID91781]